MFCLLAILATLVHSVFAATVRVPQDFQSIQAALENIVPNDTVLVAPGSYEETVVSPSMPFALIGEIAGDSSDILRPVINPSLLPNANTLSCFHLNGSHVIVENFTFKNGPEMFPHTPPDQGGVVVSGDSCVLRNCLFDSASTGLFSSSSVSLFLDECEFTDCVTLSVSTAFAQLVSRACRFDSRGVSSGPSSEFFECVFDSISTSFALHISDHAHIENSIFRHHDAIGLSTIEGPNVSGEIVGCTFMECNPSLFALGFIRDCSADLLIEDNLFLDIAPHAQAGGTISYGCTENIAGSMVTLRGNTFTHCGGNNGGKCFRTGNDTASMVFEHNRFIDNFGSGSAVSLNSQGSVFRQNVFINNGYALASVYSCDARLNYWGDSTGPHNMIHNPDGHGDEVSNSVVFDSWYIDTLFFVDAVRFPNEFPLDFSFSVYPNPFNGTTRIALNAPNAFFASIELINILGRRVKAIYHGPVIGYQEFSLNAENFPSGIYFVSIHDVVQRFALSTQKVTLLR